MKGFLKNILSSCLGSLAALLLIVVILSVATMGVVSFFSDVSNFENKPLEDEGILYLDFEGPMPDHTNNAEPENVFNISDKGIIGLQDIKKLIVEAADDEDILGIYLKPGAMTRGLSGASEIRDALLEYKSKTDKPIYSYSEYYSQKQYYIASVADSIYLNPNGMVDFTGLGMVVPYFKDMLGKIGVDVEAYYVGDFKSATEPFRRNSMSEEDRIQKKEFLRDLNSEILNDIATSRNLSYTEVESISDEMKIRNSQDAVEYKFADVLGYSSDLIRDFKTRIGVDADEKVSIISLGEYFNSKKGLLKSDNDAPIAVVYAEGNIVDNGENIGQISDEQYVDLLRRIGENDEIKAIVLRVNSGGGSAMASDNIWYQIEKLKEQGMKVVVSMGDYAASGGYYIACNADRIYAEPSTITGSIGVFGLLLSPKELMNNKLGIHFDTVQTGDLTNSFNPLFDRGEEAKKIIQNSVEDIYEQFTSRVAEGRDMDIERVKEIAGGRIYSGTDALELGLIDEVGSLQEAIKHAAELIDVAEEDITTRSYPSIKNPFVEFLNNLSEGDAPKKVMVRQLPQELKETIDYMEEIKNMKGVQARLPYQVRFE